MALEQEPRYIMPVPGLDPHNARAVFGSLTKRLDRALSRHDPSWRCLRVLPRQDGAAVLTLRLAGKEESLLWVAPEQTRSGEGEAWGALRGRGGPREARLVLARALARLSADPRFSLVSFPNRQLGIIRYNDSIVDTLIAGRCAPLHTRWFDWIFAEVFQGAADRFVLHFDGPPGRMTLAVAAPGVSIEGATLVKEAKQYCLWLVSDPRTPEARELVSEQVERFLGFLLSRAVHPGMEVAGEEGITFDGGGLSGPALSDPYGRGAPISTARWGNPHQWHQFFSDFEVSRAGLCGLVFTEPQAFVTHGEPECHRVEPNVRPHPHVYARVPFAQRHLAPEPGSREFAVVIGERDLVFGAAKSLGEALDAAEAHADARFVVLNSTCLPKMAGDDVASLVSERRAAGRKTIISMNTDLDSPEATYHDIVVQMAKPGGEDEIAAPGSGLGLLGFFPGRSRDELVKLCLAIGLPVAGCLGPELGPRQVEAYRRASLQVLYPSPPWPALQAELFGDLVAPVLSPAPPFGIKGSLDWLVAVGEAIGKGPAEIREQYSSTLAVALNRFEELRAQVAGVGVGLVVDSLEVSRLVDPARCYGVRLLPLLGECGFKVHVLVREAEDGADPAKEEENLGLLCAARYPGFELAVHRFGTEEELHALLDGGFLRLVYSEVSCDERLSRHGLLGFSLDLWELGPWGAIRSLERLARLAGWPFFSRYARTTKVDLGQSGQEEPR